MRAFYFGCSGGSGHHMFAPDKSGLTSREVHDFIAGNPWGTSVDTGLCPKGQVVEGRALLHHKDGWTALSFWDRSVDSRPGSCSTFLAEGAHPFTAMLDLAKQHFPRVVARFRFPIVDAGAPGPEQAT